MTDKRDMEFDVVAAVRELHRVAAPSDPDFVKGARLVFDVCGWAYLYYYASRYGNGGTARRMAENVADAAAAFHRWAAGAASVHTPAGSAAQAAPAAVLETSITICRKGEAGEMGRADWLDRPAMGHVLAALMPANRLVMECCMATGLRVGDVLALKTADVQHGPRMTVREQKTGKSRRVYWPAELRLRMLQQAGRVWVFEGRNDWRKHRTRSAVYKDLQRAARVFRASGVVPKGAQVSTHTGRKIRAVDEFRRTGSMGKVAALLNHDEGHSEVTLLYALADELTRRKVGGTGKRRRTPAR